MPTAGQTIDLGSSRVKIVFTKTSNDTDGRMAQMESEMEPNRRLPTLAHLHPMQEEKVTVLSGELTALIKKETRLLRAGESVLFKKGELHNFWNAGNEKAHFRVEHYPALRIQEFIETLGRLVSQRRIKYDNSFSDKLQMAVVVNKFKDTMELPMPQRAIIKLIGAIGNLMGKNKGV